jgi:hypothetical protein
MITSIIDYYGYLGYHGYYGYLLPAESPATQTTMAPLVPFAKMKGQILAKAPDLLRYE